MKVESQHFIGIYLAPVILAALFGLAQIEQVFAQDSGYSIARYDPVEENIKYRLEERINGQPPRLLDRYCGDQTIDGWIALNEKLVGRELGSTIGEIWYIQETDPESDKQVLKGCAIDVAAASDVDGILSNGERPANQILDASIGIFEDIYPNRGIVVTHEDPRRENDNIGPVQQSIINTDDAEVSIYEEPQTHDFHFHVDISEEDTTIDETTEDQAPITTITSGTVYDSRMESSSPIMTIECEPGPPDAQGNFERICGPKFKDGYFNINTELIQNK